VNIEAKESFCYLTTTGRITGRPHAIEIWFGVEGNILYMLSGGGEKSDWVRNIKREPAVRVRVGEQTYEGRARVVAPGSAEDGLARRLLMAKYSAAYSGDLSNWGQTALPVAVDILGAVGGV